MMLQSDPVPGSQPPVASDVNIFDVLTGNQIMKVINTIMNGVYGCLLKVYQGIFQYIHACNLTN